MIERAIVEKYGGKVVLIPRIGNYSTTRIMKTMVNPKKLITKTIKHYLKYIKEEYRDDFIQDDEHKPYIKFNEKEFMDFSEYIMLKVLTKVFCEDGFNKRLNEAHSVIIHTPALKIIIKQYEDKIKRLQKLTTKQK